MKNRVLVLFILIIVMMLSTGCGGRDVKHSQRYTYSITFYETLGKEYKTSVAVECLEPEKCRIDRPRIVINGKSIIPGGSPVEYIGIRLGGLLSRDEFGIPSSKGIKIILVKEGGVVAREERVWEEIFPYNKNMGKYK